MDDIQNQLTQMKTALAVADDSDKPGIQMIIDQLEELLGVYSTDRNQPNTTETEVGEEDEYRLFQAEIAALDPEKAEELVNDEQTDTSNDTSNESSSKDNTDDTTNSIGNELEDLIGMKCMAPHQENWGQIGYYSAMVSSVLSLEQGADNEGEGPSDISSILVRVIFLQPVVKSQLLCPFYKEDRCKFSDEDCKFSHGEVVPLSQLREYSEPDYASVVPGTRVLAKYHDDLYYKATITRITEDGECEVSYDVGNEALIVPLYQTCPINDKDSDGLSDDSSDEDDIENPNLSSSDSELDIPKTLLGGDGLMDMKGETALGEWEKFTKGIGSKLMLQMGYVLGTGLGKNKEGRVEPVDAIVLPPGKSLDACMELKEKAKDGNLFSVEKRRLKLQRKAEKRRAKLAAQKPKAEGDVFEFLNSKLALRKNISSNSSHKNNPELRKQSISNLNKRLLGLEENIRQINKDIVKTKESMERQKGRDKETYAVMKNKLETLESKRQELKVMQNSVTNEQKLRSDKRKLLSF